MTLSRRTLLGAGLSAGAALAFAPRSLADTAMPDWAVGFRTAPAKGFGPAPMRLTSGKAPAGLSGALYRNGPAHMQYGASFVSHWFDGDGMVQRIAIADGKAVHTGRYVDTPKRRAELAAGKFLAPGFGTLGDESYPVASSDDSNSANISVLMSGGELLALWEAGSPWRLDPVTLESRGPKIWRPDLKGMPFLAHPKREPDGRLWSLAVSGPNVGVYRIASDGTLEDFSLVDVGVAAYIHDWTMTEDKLVILLQPWLFTRDLPPYVDGLEWRPQEGMKILILDKDDLTKRRWAQAPARAFYHTGAAWEDGEGVIRIDGAFYASPVLGSGGGAGMVQGKYFAGEDPAGILSQLVIPLKGDVRIVETDVEGEFTQVDPRRHGLPRRLTALVSGSVPGRPGNTALSLHDWQTGRTDTYDFGRDTMIEEHLFVPKPGGTGERDCWLVGTAINVRAGATEVFVFDAANVPDGPVAVWRADYAWPLGFHGMWAQA